MQTPHTLEPRTSRVSLIVVSGPPASGKTTISAEIGRQFSLPVFNKDGIKEALMDSLGYMDREWSVRLGIVSMDILFLFTERQLQAGRSAIVESTFQQNFERPKFKVLQRKYNFELIEVYCYADRETLVSRFMSRAKDGNRHRGHMESQQVSEFTRRLESQVWSELNLNGPVIRVDTTKCDDLLYPNLFRQLSESGIHCY